ncbi:MNIO family bufferin maturase [Flexibacterium corallicola]|uniref:MNIO family bufferin maturase n=1 Tax=Flexibacterium corallicola TaxID=3037259 RepID=UPI00286F421E|nr:DUF692 domain-containing protein [Pseudovibrio sp. M1P-2-3]
MSSNQQRVEALVSGGAGVGLKAEHYREILEAKPPMAFFEIHAENYMGAGGAPHAYLEEIRQCYPLSVHGVGLSIGGEGSLNRDHMLRLKSVVDRYEPGLVSEHLAWSTHDTHYYNDLLPAPYTRETLDRVVSHICQLQEVLGRKILLENPSTYVVFEQSTYSETDFLKEVVNRSGCGLLLDINNVFVSATNHGYSAQGYLSSFPLEHVEQYHLGGHAQDEDEHGYDLLIDAHDREVCDPVWLLYEQTVQKTGRRPTLIEWDANVPQWPVLAKEAYRAEAILNRQGNLEKDREKSIAAE